MYSASLAQMLHDAYASGRKTAYITVLSENMPSRRVIERVGFEHTTSFFQTTRWGKVARWGTGVIY